MAVEHVVKCWPQYYDAIARGEKPFDVRRDDRGYQKGDTLVLQRTVRLMGGSHEVDRDYHGKVRHEIRRTITYILTGGQFGIEPGFVVLGIPTPTEI